MKGFRIFLALLSCMALPVISFSQEGPSPLVFEAYGCDFGEVEEAGGTLFQTFHFINGSSDPVRILRVAASCSCVSVSYPQALLEGGEAGEISVAFNPARTAGDVFRNVDIILSGGLPGVSLTLKAHVIPSEYDIEDVYSVSLPDGVRLTTLSQRFGYIAAGKIAERRIDVINSSSSPVTLGTEMASEAGFLAVACPERLGQGEAGSLILRYTLPDRMSGYGMHEDSVTLLVNGRPCNRPLTVSCIGIEEIDNKGNAPSLQVYPSRLEMKRKLLGKGYSGYFEIRNNGKSDLRIRKVDIQDGAAADLPDGAVLKPGARRKVSVRSASPELRLGLVTNDPARPYKEMRTR